MTDQLPVGAEADLVQRAKQGDQAAFAEIYDRHQAAVYRYILYRVSDEALAEDLTSEVFVRLVEKIDRFTYQGRPVLAWLYTIARNLVIDHFRHRGRAVTLSLDDEAGPDVADPNWDPDRTLTRETLTNALRRLTEDQRMVILLKFVEGYDNDAVAGILGKPVGAVKSLQHRALATLNRILRPSIRE